MLLEFIELPNLRMLLGFALPLKKVLPSKTLLDNTADTFNI